MLTTSTAQQKTHPVVTSISQVFGTSMGYAEAVLDHIINNWKDYPSIEELYAQNSESRVYLEYSLGAMWRGRQVAQRIKALHPNPKRALDIGSGSGGVLVALAEQDINVLGVELEPHLVALSKLATQDFNCVEVVSANVLTSDTESWGKFDVICCNAVIEHVLNPERLLSQIGTLLADGGVVHIEIPNKDCISNTIQDLHYQMFGLQLLPRSGALSLHRSLMPNTDYTVGEFFDLDWYQSRLRRLNISTELLISDWGSRYETAEADLGRLWAAFEQWNQQAETENNYLLRHEVRRRFLRYFSDACFALAAAHEGDPDSFERKYGAMAWVLVGGRKPHSY